MVKIRDGWVSNSSSCSFVCVICHRGEGGFDLCADDCGMCVCEEGHAFFESHLDMDTDDIRMALYPIFKERGYKDLDFEVEQYMEEYPYEVPVELCPICTGEFVFDKEIVEFLLKHSGLKLEDVKKEILDKIGCSDFYEQLVEDRRTIPRRGAGIPRNGWIK